MRLIFVGIWFRRRKNSEQCIGLKQMDKKLKKLVKEYLLHRPPTAADRQIARVANMPDIITELAALPSETEELMKKFPRAFESAVRKAKKRTK